MSGIPPELYEFSRKTVKKLNYLTKKWNDNVDVNVNNYTTVLIVLGNKISW